MASEANFQESTINAKPGNLDHPTLSRAAKAQSEGGHGPFASLQRPKAAQTPRRHLPATLRVSSGRDHHKLLSSGFRDIRDWRRGGAGGQGRFPDFLSGVHVKRSKEGIASAANEEQSARGNNWPAQSDGAGGQIRMFAPEVAHRSKRHLPANRSLSEIDGR